MKKDKKGFTLVELIVVIAILGIIVTIAVPKFIGYYEKARTSADMTTYAHIEKAISAGITNEDIKTGDLICSTNSSGVVTWTSTATPGNVIAINALLPNTVIFHKSTHLSLSPLVTFVIAADGTITVTTAFVP